MTKEEKKALYTCNIGDFIRNFKDKKYKSEGGVITQFGDSLAYLAKYNMEGVNKECEFFDLVYAAKKSIINQAIEQKVNKKGESHYEKMWNDYGDNFDSVKKFISDPADYLKDVFQEYANEEDDEELDPEIRKYNTRLKENAKKLSETYLSQREKYREYEANAKAKELEFRILEKYPGKVAKLDDIFEKNKGGFLERTFNTTSQDFKNFKVAFDDYRNPNSVYHGKDEHVEIEAIKYLQHVIPAYRDDSELPTKAQLEALTGTKKGRADFCVSVIEAVRERREQQKALEDLMDNIQNEYEIEDESLIEEEQNIFQQQIQEDVKDSVAVEDQKEVDINAIEQNKEVEP